MSELRVDSVKSKGGGAPDLPKGVTISGIATAATLGATTVDVSNVNVSGVVTSGTLSGSLLSTGTPTLGLGVTINSSGLVVSGVATAGIVSATTLYGDGSNITGVGASITPLFYNPDPYDSGLSFGTGIGITFNQQIKAGTGNITLRLVGAAGTVVENFGVGSSVTISENKVTIDPTADLSVDTIYHISYPSGCFTNNEGTDYVGTAYTFQARPYDYQLWVWGQNDYGQLGLNSRTQYSSPTQVPGTTWATTAVAYDGKNQLATKNDGTLWVWGSNSKGNLGLNNRTTYSSPVQVPGTTWATATTFASHSLASRTDGTLWSMGYNNAGQLGQNQGGIPTDRSSPTQIPGTTWGTGYKKFGVGLYNSMAVKTDGTLWSWGYNWYGILGLNEASSTAYKSSPTQIPGTTWKSVNCGERSALAIKTDGTMWSWGRNTFGELGLNDRTNYSSPKQIPGTTWSELGGGGYIFNFATKTDGTLWSWGYNGKGRLGVNSNASSVYAYSSPVQIPGTTWDTSATGLTKSAQGGTWALKQDGTLWSWGYNNNGQLGVNNRTNYSSPVQIGSDTTWIKVHNGIGGYAVAAIKKV